MHTARPPVNESRAMIIQELIALLGFRVEGEQNIRRFQDGIRGASESLSDFAREAVALGAVIGTAVASAAALMGRAAIATGAEFERMEATLTIIEGSAEKARQSLDWVTQFAETTPYQLGEVSDAFVRMRAYGLDPMDGSLRAVGDAASAMGKTIMDGVEAIADASTGENERLKEFGIVASVAGDRITYTWQQAGEQMSRTVSKNAGEITAALTEIFNGRFAGAMNAQAKTFDGLMSNIGDRWTAFKRMVADAGWFDFVKTQAGDFIELFDRLRREGVIDRYAQQISAALIAMGTRLRAIGETLGPLVIPTIDGLARAMQRAGEFALFLGESVARVVNDVAGTSLDENSGLMLLIAAVVASRKPKWFILGAIAAAIEDIVTYSEGGESVFGNIVSFIENMMNVSQSTAEAIGGIGAAIAGLALLQPAKAIALAFVALTTPAGWAIIIGGIGLALLVAFREEIMGLPWVQEGIRIGQEIASGIAQGLGNIASIVRGAIGLGESGLEAMTPAGRADAARQGSAIGALATQSSSSLAAGAAPGGMVNSGNTQTNSFQFNQTFSGSPLTEGQVRSATRDAALEAIRSLGSTANPGSP